MSLSQKITHGTLAAATGVVVAMGSAPTASAAPTGFCSASYSIGSTRSVYHYGHYDTYKYIYRYRLLTGEYVRVWDNLTHNDASNTIYQRCMNQ